MRSEQEMMNMLVDFARNDNRIRLAYPNYDEVISKYTANIYRLWSEALAI